MREHVFEREKEGERERERESKRERESERDARTETQDIHLNTDKQTYTQTKKTYWQR